MEAMHPQTLTAPRTTKTAVMEGMHPQTLTAPNPQTAVMHFGGLEVEAAISAAKKCRPIIDPIGGLPQLLAKISEAYK
jgi:hypothetical protein